MSTQNRKVSLLFFHLTLLLALVMLTISGCSTVNEQHPLIVTKDIKPDDIKDFAIVYFIRPKPFKSKGAADNSIRVEFQGNVLLSIDEGSYTLLHIKPSKNKLTVFSETLFTNISIPIEVWRAREYKFIAGKTYFIHLKRMDEEYRGIFYDIEPVNLDKAKILIDTTIASGAARNAPIDELTNVQEPPASAIKGLSPALPENIYKRETYLK